MFNVIALFLVFLSVSIKAQELELDGGLEAFLRDNTIYPTYSRQNCIQGTVEVGFKLNTNGEVYYATITKGIGTDLDDEALRLIKLTSRKWKVPANHDSLALVTIPMRFSLRGYDCEEKNKSTITNAIRAYQVEKELTNVVLSFYRNKEIGNYNAADEPKISKIKEDLGIDDDYLDGRVNLGLKKIKQGDKRGACDDFNFVKYMGSTKANELLLKYCN